MEETKSQFDVSLKILTENLTEFETLVILKALIFAGQEEKERIIALISAHQAKIQQEEERMKSDKNFQALKNAYEEKEKQEEKEKRHDKKATRKIKRRTRLWKK